jgi:hypothetical protein
MTTCDTLVLSFYDTMTPSLPTMHVQGPQPSNNQFQNFCFLTTTVIWVNPKVIIVKYYHFKYICMLISIDVWVPWIGDVPNCHIGLKILSGIWENRMVTYGKGQYMAITFNLRKIKMGSVAG